jgi:DnaK suppressor protein
MVAKKSSTLTSAPTDSARATPRKAAGKAVSTKAAPKKDAATAKKTATGTKAAAARKVTTVTKKPAATSVGTKPGSLAVREGESPWTAEEIDETRSTLRSDAERLLNEIDSAEIEINSLLREGGEGAGNDQADVGSNTFERDHEMSMAKNARLNLELVESALLRIDQGSYGVCESCGQPIGKLRLQAFPRATLCMQCKQRQERR